MALPARILENPKNFPLIEKEMGAPIPYFVSAGSFEIQLAQIFQPQVVLSSDFSLLGVSKSNSPQQEKDDVQWVLSPGAGSDEPISATLFLSQRMGLGLPHLGLLGRSGFLGSLFRGMEWESLDADDAYSLALFLKRVGERPEERVRVLQLSALDVPDALRALRPRRYPLGIGDEISTNALRVLDLKLGRALGAIRQDRRLSVVVLPYPERFHERVFSNAFIRMGEGVSNSVLSSLRSQGSLAIAADVALLRAVHHEKPTTTVVEGAGMCHLMRVAPELFQKGASDVRRDLFRSAYGFVTPVEENVVAVSPEARSLGAGLYRLAAFCRNDAGVERLVVWIGEGGVAFSEKQWPVVRDEILSTETSVQNPKSHLRSKTLPTKTVETALWPVMALSGRVMVYRMSTTSGVEADPAADKYLEENAVLLRKVFFEVVEESRDQ